MKNKALLQAILRFVCTRLKVSISDVKFKSRDPELVLARKFYAGYAHTYTDISLTDIGLFINRDHASIIHYIKTLNGSDADGEETGAYRLYKSNLHNVQNIIEAIKGTYRMDDVMVISKKALYSHICARFTHDEVLSILKEISNE